MNLLVDEDSEGKLLVRLLREAGHDVITATETGLASHPDREVFAVAQREKRVLLTRNVRDFRALHAAHAAHAGILVEHQDQDPAKNMSAAEVVRAIANLEASGWDLAGQFVAINAWNFPVAEANGNVSP